MGKPRLIILVRHAQSEGNKNRDIHQYIPDHRVKLTQEGHAQAQQAGRRLRSMLQPNDTVRFYTSPYRRTRETTENIISTLTEPDAETGPSPWARDDMKVYEEPRLREQDFGNFQPCSAEMERMWQERADYGHFFYRIPNGESAADAYDRVSGFNESLWRSFGDEDFPSVCVLVTHGLMTRVFLMKWYHWTVERFEDLRNINHCEFIVMKQEHAKGKYVLENELRTWSDLKRRAAALNGGKVVLDTPSYIPQRRWGGCAEGCDHAKVHLGHKMRRINTKDILHEEGFYGPNAPNEKEDHAHAVQADAHASAAAKHHHHLPDKVKKLVVSSKSPSKGPKKVSKANDGAARVEDVDVPPEARDTAKVSDRDFAAEAAGAGADDAGSEQSADSEEWSDGLEALPIIKTSEGQIQHIFTPVQYGRDAGGSRSGIGTPEASDESDSHDTTGKPHSLGAVKTSLFARHGKDHHHGIGKHLHKSAGTSHGAQMEDIPMRPKKDRSASTTSIKTEREWIEDSGMASGLRADALGDTLDEGGKSAAPLTAALEAVAEVERMEEKSRKGFDEVY